jgi:coronin-1B/1C/6
MSRFVRPSKYRYVRAVHDSFLLETEHSRRHVFGQPAKKEHGIENVKVSNSAWDTNLINASGVREFLNLGVQSV